MTLTLCENKPLGQISNLFKEKMRSYCICMRSYCICSREEKHIDPKKVVTVETSIRSSLNPDLISDDEEGEELDEETR